MRTTGGEHLENRRTRAARIAVVFYDGGLYQTRSFYVGFLLRSLLFDE